MTLQPKQQPPYYQQGVQVKEYTALITQTSGIPTAIVLVNTYPGTWIYTEDGTGLYTLTNTGQLTLNKTTVNLANQGYYIVGAGQNDVNSIFIQSNNHDGTPVEGVFLNTMLQIKTYSNV